MDISSLSKKKLRYYLNFHFSNSSQLLFTLLPLPKTLVSPKPSPNQLFNSKHFRRNPTSSPPYSFISSAESSSSCSITHISSQSSHFYGCDSHRSSTSISSSGLSSVSTLTYPSHQSSRPILSNGYIDYRGKIFKNSMLKPHSRVVFRWLSVSSFDVSPCQKLGIDGFRPHATPTQVSEIIELTRNGANDLESMLNLMNVRLSVTSVLEIFRVLNFERVSALRFFNWIRHWQPEFYLNSDICNFAIDNCGRLDDFGAMRCLLNDFGLHGVCLTQEAFGFVPVMISSKASMKKSICKMMDVLNEVGGSCRASGFPAMIEMLSILGSFEMAKYVVRKTEKKASYYNILIREMCRRCDFAGARDMLNEMRKMDCDPGAQTYNYMLSFLCKTGKATEAWKVFEEMFERDCPLNALTFEIFIHYLCRLGKLDFAFELLDRMASIGIEPRLTTHAAFINGYLNLQRYEAAYKYVACSSDKYKHSSNMMYSLLASLHQKKGNAVIAQNILSEMIKKGLRPQFSVYMRVLKHLQKSGRKDLATNLENSFSSLSLQSSTDVG